MGLWRDNLHWSVLLNRGVLAVSLPALITLGGVLLVPEQYRLANTCFIVAGLLALAKITHLAISTPDPTHSRLLFAAIGYAVVGMLTVALVRGVNGYAERQRQARIAAVVTKHVSARQPQLSTTPTAAPNEHRTATAQDISERAPGSRTHPLKIKPSVLTKLYETHTQLQADMLFKPYIGQWILISGKVGEVVNNVGMDGHRESVQVLLSVGHELTTVSLNFSAPAQRDAAALFNKGDPITATCRIHSAARFGVMTEQCEIAND
jgi:hypothetical protein